MHEVRCGESGRWQPRSIPQPYYGTVDATPLFVMLLGELPAGDRRRITLRELLPAADRALAWIEQRRRDGDGFVEYRRATDRGLVNQGWKDSFDGVASPTAASPSRRSRWPRSRATSTRRTWPVDELARAVDERRPRRERQRAEVLRKRIQQKLWLADRGHVREALDGDKRPVDALTSNMGHCLWRGSSPRTGPPAWPAPPVAETMFTGLGVRTLARMGGYNPISYHNGSVWPHDNAIVVAGLVRYGYMGRPSGWRAMLDAAGPGGRLPELFCGFDRDEFARPCPTRLRARPGVGGGQPAALFYGPCCGSTPTCGAGGWASSRPCRRRCSRCGWATCPSRARG